MRLEVYIHKRPFINKCVKSWRIGGHWDHNEATNPQDGRKEKNKQNKVRMDITNWLWDYKVDNKDQNDSVSLVRTKAWLPVCRAAESAWFIYFTWTLSSLRAKNFVFGNEKGKK